MDKKDKVNKLEQRKLNLSPIKKLNESHNTNQNLQPLSKVRSTPKMNVKTRSARTATTGRAGTAKTENVGGYKEGKFDPNANTYLHVLNDKTTSSQGVEYILDLRKYNQNGTIGIRSSTAAQPPNFYSDDLKKIQERKSKTSLLVNSKYNDLSYANLEFNHKDNENTITVDHLVRKRIGENGSGNISQVLFETSLRQGKFISKTGVPRWNGVVYSPPRTRPITGYIPPTNNNCIREVELHENDYVKNYEVVHNVYLS